MGRFLRNGTLVLAVLLAALLTGCTTEQVGQTLYNMGKAYCSEASQCESDDDRTSNVPRS